MFTVQGENGTSSSKETQKYAFLISSRFVCFLHLFLTRSHPSCSDREDDTTENQDATQLDASYFMVQLKPVLHESETRPAEFVAVYISEVANPKLISSIIAYLSSKYPMESLSHLKRIRKVPTSDPKVWRTEVVIGLVSALQSDTDAFEFLKNRYELTLKIYDVPRYEPLMKAQYETWTKIWPITLKAHIPSTPDPTEVFSSDMVQKFVSCLRQLVPLAKQTGNACAILDSSAVELLTATTSSDTVLSHCCINAINMVAEKQLKDSSDVQYVHHKRLHLDHGSDPKPIDYLCNGCTAILVREPCIMCSMALLHSRIACVIYAVSNPTSGGLGSKFSVHCEPRLNHHFHVYKGLLEDEILGTLE